VPRISGVARPLAREPRVCRGYEPVFGAHDRRGARVLWPELFSEASVPPASDAAEVEALEDKHGTLAPTARE
jgi:hypothetical protein